MEPEVWDVYEQACGWEEARDLYGFGGADNPGSSGKYLGRPGLDGPWFYRIRHLPDTFIPRHTHDGDVYHFLTQGSWMVGEERVLVLPGFFHFEPKGAFWGPLWSGSEGSEFIAIYSERPSFILPTGADDRGGPDVQEEGL